MLYDITEPLYEATPHWPGDVPFSRRIDAELSKGQPFNASSFHMSVHLGTHCDAPNHFLEDGKGIDELPLDVFTGVCRVLEIRGDGPIGPEDWPADALKGVQRVLFKTRGRPLRQVDAAGAHLTEEAAVALVEAKVRLAGIDSPSFDPLDSEDFPAHRVLLGAGVALLERLELSKVPASRYELFAFPLRIVGADGAPVRAVLRTI